MAGRKKKERAEELRAMSDADLANIYAFVRSRPEPAKEIPLLRP